MVFMKISDGKFVRIFQWFAPVVMPFLIFFGHGFLGAPLGWMGVIGIIYGPFILAAMYLVPVIGLFDRDARAARGTRQLYDVFSWIAWASMLLMTFTIVDGGDTPPFESVVSAWGLMNDEASAFLFHIGFFISIFGLLSAFVTNIIGIVVSRRDK